MITFRSSQGDAVRGTLTNLQRHALVMEVYNPHSVIQVSEVLSELTVRSGDKRIYRGKAIVVSLVNTGLMALVSVTLIDAWFDLNAIHGDLSQVGVESQRFVTEWEARFCIRPSYQVVISEFRAFLAETSRWADQLDMSHTLPRETDGRLREDVFYELATPLMTKCTHYLRWLEDEAKCVPLELAVAHRNFAQMALHPLLLRAPFVYRTFTKPLGYAGDYEMVNQILDDPRQGGSTYCQMVNTLFLNAPVAVAHRNRIDMLVERLIREADRAATLGRRLRVLNVACGPAVEIQRFIVEYPHPERLSFELLDFNEETLTYTRDCIEQIGQHYGKYVDVTFTHESVHELLKRAVRRKAPVADTVGFDFIYCAGLFDYLSDKVCARLVEYFVGRSLAQGRILVTNVHPANPSRNGMEHLLEWHLIYRNEEQLLHILPTPQRGTDIYTDQTGVNVFAEMVVSPPKGGR